MNPIAGAILGIVSAVSTKKQNEAQGRLAAHRESQLKAQDNLNFAREKELIRLRNANSSKSSSSDKSKDYQSQILVDQHKLNNELLDSEKGFKNYPSLFNMQGDSQNKATLLYAMRNNKNVPFHILKKAEHTYNLLMNDPNFNSADTINAWNDLARLEPHLMESINIPTSSNTPTTLSSESTATAPAEKELKPAIDILQQKNKRNLWDTIVNAVSYKKPTVSNGERHRKIIEEEYQQANQTIAIEEILANTTEKKNNNLLKGQKTVPKVISINDFNLDTKPTRNVNR